MHNFSFDFVIIYFRFLSLNNSRSCIKMWFWVSDSCCINWVFQVLCLSEFSI